MASNIFKKPTTSTGNTTSGGLIFGPQQGGSPRSDPMDLFSFDPREGMQAGMDILFGTAPGIMTQTVVDPLKQDVANPLSAYLAGQIGKGIPRYEGPLSYEFSGTEQTNYLDFIGSSASDVFQESIADPAMKEFKENLLPVIREGFAGSLRGSGRFREEEAGISQFSEALSAQRAGFIPEFQQKQIQTSLAFKDAIDKDYSTRYNAWLRELPQYNPALQQALTFLNVGTGTGTTVLSALDPGDEGIIAQILAMFSS